MKKLFFLIGDVHFAEITTTMCVPLNPKTNKTYPFKVALWEITSSGTLMSNKNLTKLKVCYVFIVGLTHSIGLLPYGLGFLLDFYFRWVNRSDHVKANTFGIHVFVFLF
jgi:hypothetical protein